jgi:hypothetical protein
LSTIHSSGTDLTGTQARLLLSEQSSLQIEEKYMKPKSIANLKKVIRK